MIDLNISEILKLKNFPDSRSVVEIGGSRISVSEFGDGSLYDQLAMLSHFFNNREKYDEEESNRIRSYYQSFLLRLYPDKTEEDLNAACETWDRLNLFSDFSDAPFRSAKNWTFRFIDLFAGIGGIRIPFTELGGKCVFSSEWDRAAQTTYAYNFGEVPFGDITKINEDFIPAHDVLLAGFPCQAFSIMGKMKGFEDTRGTLFFEVARILRKHRPKAILLENVKQLVSHDHGNTFRVILNTLEDIGYHVKWKILNALDFGVPQKRERTIIVGFLDEKAYASFNFDFPKQIHDLATLIESDDSVDRSLFASPDIIAKRQNRVAGKEVFYPSVWHENKSGNVSVLPYACALRTGASYNYLLINGYRRPSSRELLRFQGFPESYRIVVSHSEIRRQTGNSVAVPMIRAIAKKIIEQL